MGNPVIVKYGQVIIHRARDLHQQNVTIKDFHFGSCTTRHATLAALRWALRTLCHTYWRCLWRRHG